MTEGDFIVPETRGSAWRVGRVEREGDEQHGFAIAIYKWPDDELPAIREREGTTIHCIHRPV
ncbi:hypothetical protein A9W97_20670 [Mycobacterium gordonae]|nr:hypothetical protein A9W97_20670 [Mycobacterium gordonae]